MDKSYQLNSSYESQQSLPPRNKQFSPVITQLMRKDREIEIMRDELTQQNYLIDELSQQVQYLEQQLRDNEGFKEKYQSLSEEYASQQKDVLRLKMPIQTTSAKEIMNQFIEYEKQTDSNPQQDSIDFSQFYLQELESSLNREFEQKELLDQLIQHFDSMNKRICKKNNDILEITMNKLEETLQVLMKKEEELLFYKEKSRMFYEILQCNMDITALYKKQHQGLRQALKGCWTLSVDQSQQIEQMMKLVDVQSNNSESIKPLLENLQSSCKQNKLVSQLESYILKNCKVEGRSAIDKIQKMIIKLDQYQEICQNIQDEKQEIIEELQFYKNKLEEQDETIKEFERVLSEMENNFGQQLNTQQLQEQAIRQKDELIMHYQTLLDDYKSQKQQKVLEEPDEKQKEINTEEILRIIIMILQGYNITSNEYQLNIDTNGINLQKKVFIDINPIVNSQMNKIQQIVSNQYYQYGKNYHELITHIMNCLQLMKQQLPQHQFKNFQNDNCIEYLEKFYQISQCYYVKQEKLTTNEKELYRKYYLFIPRLIGELVENQTTKFIKLLREKVYNSIMCEPILQNKS